MSIRQTARWAISTAAACLLLACGRIHYDPTPADDVFDSSVPLDSSIPFDSSTPFDGEVPTDGFMLTDAGSETDAFVVDGGFDMDAESMDSSFSTDSSLAMDAAPAGALIVEPTYPTHAAWNAYVLPTVSAADANHQPDIDCPPPDPSDGIRCIHGGERRRVQTVFPSCDELNLIDDLNAFLWRCDDRSGTAIFFSYGLAQGRGLGDLIESDGSSWRSIGVTLFHQGMEVEASSPSIWWENQLKPLMGGGTLTNDDTAIGDVYVAIANQTVTGITLGDHRIALVTLPGVTVSFDAAAPTNCASTAGGSIDARCLVYAEGQSFLWIEGSFQGVRSLTNLRGMILRGLRNSRVRRVRMRSTGSFGLRLETMRECRFEDIHQQDSGTHGVYALMGSFNRFSNIRISTNAGNGFHAQGDVSTVYWVHNVVSNLYVSNSSGTGVALVCGTRDNILTNVVTVSNAGRGVDFSCNVATTLSHVTSVANYTAGIEIYNDNTKTIVQAIMSASSLGFNLSSSTGRYAQIVATNNSGAGIHVKSNGSQFHRTLMVGNNAVDCTIQSGVTTPGLIENTCTVSGTEGSSDYGVEASTATLRTGRTITHSFLGRVTADDSINSSDADGFAAAPTDWTNFESPYRFWGRDRATLTESGMFGRCNTNCRVWDLRLAATDNQLLYRSGDGATVSIPVAGAMCPAWLRGDVTLTDFARFEIIGDGRGDDDGICEPAEPCHPPNTFLVNALEVIGDDVGDEDGLCESGETCIASPHFGAWQGDGEPTGSCIFDPGPAGITNVTMLVRE